jgi:hypothetical protein
MESNGKKKVFDFYFIIVVDIYLLHNAKYDNKYDTRYFQSLIRQKLHGKSILHFARSTNILIRKFKQTLKTALHCGKF